MSCLICLLQSFLYQPMTTATKNVHPIPYVEELHALGRGHDPGWSWRADFSAWCLGSTNLYHACIVDLQPKGYLHAQSSNVVYSGETRAVLLCMPKLRMQSSKSSQFVHTVRDPQCPEGLKYFKAIVQRITIKLATHFGRQHLRRPRHAKYLRQREPMKTTFTKLATQ